MEAAHDAIGAEGTLQKRQQEVLAAEDQVRKDILCNICKEGETVHSRDEWDAITAKSVEGKYERTGRILSIRAKWASETTLQCE